LHRFFQENWSVQFGKARTNQAGAVDLINSMAQQ
jgi:hypothetical protein